MAIFKNMLDAIDRDIRINPFKLLELNDEDKKKLKRIERGIATIEIIIGELG